MTTEQRLAAVERQLRFHRAVIAGLLLALVALVGYGATEGVPEEIRARSFKVVGEDGRELVVIRSWLLGGRIDTYPNTGRYYPSVSLAHSDDGAGLITVGNHEGKDVFAIGTTATGSHGILGLFAKDESIGVKLIGRNKVGSGGAVELYNKTGEGVVDIYADEYGMGYVGAFNREGKGRALTPR